MSWFSSIFNPIQCEAPAEQSKPQEGSSTSHNKDETTGPVNAEKQKEATTPSGKPDSKGEEAEEEEGEEKEEEPEEEEPEDILPGLRDQCKESKACVSYAKHFEHCEERVHNDQGFKGEDCVEELLMHCVDSCVAPKLFAKLK